MSLADESQDSTAPAAYPGTESNFPIQVFEPSLDRFGERAFENAQRSLMVRSPKSPSCSNHDELRTAAGGEEVSHAYLRLCQILTRIVTRMVAGRYELIYAREIKEHLRVIDRKHHSLIRRTIEEQLWFEPDVETKNRKPLRRGPMYEAEWEIRFGPDNRFRVFYEVDRDRRSVSILAIGVKKGHRLRIGGQEVSR